MKSATATDRTNAPSETEGLHANQFTNSLGMPLVLIPAGEFQMGADEDPSDTLKAFPYAPPDWVEGETPRHSVRITKSFYMAAYQTRLKDFLNFYHAANHQIEAERDDKPRHGLDSTGRPIKASGFRPWRPGLGADRRTPRELRELERCGRVLRMAQPAGGEEVPPADRGGMGIRVPGWIDDLVFVRQRSGGTNAGRECRGSGHKEPVAERGGQDDAGRRDQGHAASPIPICRDTTDMFTPPP